MTGQTLTPPPRYASTASHGRSGRAGGSSGRQRRERAVERGAVTGLIGPDGAGKTTLMRLCIGLLRPDAGQIDVLGIDVGRQPG